MRRRPKPPGDLGDAGLGLWRPVVAAYDLSPAEVETLRQASRVVDVLARVDAELAAGPVTVEGSMGQPKAHPLLQVSADQRRVLSGLLRDLALPFPSEEQGRRRSPQQVQAAQERWRAQRG